MLATPIMPFKVDLVPEIFSLSQYLITATTAHHVSVYHTKRGGGALVRFPNKRGTITHPSSDESSELPIPISGVHLSMNK